MKDIIEIFKAYNGNGYYGILFIGALVYIWFKEEDKITRAILVYVPAIIQVLFFVPYFYYGYNKLDNGTYYRLLWLLPATIVIAYGACLITDKNFKTGIIIISVIIVLSGSCVYLSPNLRKADNAYHLPGETLELCDMIMPEEGRERVWAAFPPSQVHFVRQYTTRIMLPFGRDSLVETWTTEPNPVFELYMETEMDVESLSKYATEYFCHYIILEKNRIVKGDLDKMDIKKIGETDNYYVYRNNKVELY